MEQFVYATRTDATDGRIKDYEIYVSETPLDESAGGHVNWDPALIAASGQFLSNYGSDDPANEGYQLVDLTPMVGQYVYLLGITWHTNYIGAGEVWVFGSPPGTGVEEFAVSDTTTGSSFFTDEATINVALTGRAAPEQTLDGWQVTESDVEPTTWLTECPTTYTITGAEGTATLYGWVKDTGPARRAPQPASSTTPPFPPSHMYRPRRRARRSQCRGRRVRTPLAG